MNNVAAANGSWLIANVLPIANRQSFMTNFKGGVV